MKKMITIETIKTSIIAYVKYLCGENNNKRIAPEIVNKASKIIKMICKTYLLVAFFLPSLILTTSILSKPVHDCFFNCRSPDDVTIIRHV